MDSNITGAIIAAGGAIVGAAISIFANYVNNRGKLNIHAKWDGIPGTKGTPCTSKEKTEKYSYELYLDLYNGNANNKIMRDISVEFKNKKKVLFSQTPNDHATTAVYTSGRIHNKVCAINVPPKTILQYRLFEVIWSDKLKDFWLCGKVQLSYLNENGKRKTVLITELDHDRCFQEVNEQEDKRKQEIKKQNDKRNKELEDMKNQKIKEQEERKNAQSTP